MPWKSKTVQQKAASIAKAHASHRPSRISDSVSVPDPEMNNITMPKTSPSPGLEIITDLDNEEVTADSGNLVITCFFCFFGCGSAQAKYPKRNICMYLLCATTVQDLRSLSRFHLISLTCPLICLSLLCNRSCRWFTLSVCGRPCRGFWGGMTLPYRLKLLCQCWMLRKDTPNMSDISSVIYPLPLSHRMRSLMSLLICRKTILVINSSGMTQNAWETVEKQLSDRRRP